MRMLITSIFLSVLILQGCGLESDDVTPGVAADATADATCQKVWYLDNDKDGFGVDGDSNIVSCTPQEGYAEVSGDCDDKSKLVHPDAPEICDNIDNDCDGNIDDNEDKLWWIDYDGDGFGDKAIEFKGGCVAKNQTVDNSNDCDDNNNKVFPKAPEFCDGLDNDCDGQTDEADAKDVKTWHRDLDNDGYGNDKDQTVKSCFKPEGYSKHSTDCNDDHVDISPAVSETCNKVDDNCDGQTDEGVTTPFYKDKDADSYGDALSDPVLSCLAPTGYVLNKSDCNDNLNLVNPAGVEKCDGIDNDCNGVTDDETAKDAKIYYEDLDWDNYGNSKVWKKSCKTFDKGWTLIDGDCDDTKSKTYPGSQETCDGFDNDCDGKTDEEDADAANVYYEDSDEDGFGNPGSVIKSCKVPVIKGKFYVSNNKDCNDSNNKVYPQAKEYCDGVDNNCNGAVDEDTALDAKTWYPDVDKDGYGNGSVSIKSCKILPNYSLIKGDCDDTDNDNHPNAKEVCDDEDNDCDGKIDEGTSINAKSWYKDADGDGYGDGKFPLSSCKPPKNYVSNKDDCNDKNKAVNPAADEVCDSVDNNCDGQIDEPTAKDAKLFYKDDDGDSYGSPAKLSKKSCIQLKGYVLNKLDCDDSNKDVSPKAVEVCDGSDNDCDGVVNESDALDAKTWYKDADGDLFGDDKISVQSCKNVKGYVLYKGDCDDSDNDNYPGADEVCDDDDNDCDGKVDESDAKDTSFWYKDADNDSFGDLLHSVKSCTAPKGYVKNSADCDDKSKLIGPFAKEVCDNVDNDCDGKVDESDATDAKTLYKDGDNDLYGNVDVSIKSCNPVKGYVSDKTDCNDKDVNVHPGGVELCDNIDNNCNGKVDEEAAKNIVDWYKDADDDGFGNPKISQKSCKPIPGFVTNKTDCDDTDNDNRPNAKEVCDGEDNNCDGKIDESSAEDASVWYVDSDKDGYGNTAVSVKACKAPPGTIDVPGDCDDAKASVNPKAAELCDNIDNNCNGKTDEGNASDAKLFYRDKDKDSFGNPDVFVKACKQPDGYTSDKKDCNDNHPKVNPKVVETCDNIDNNCDGKTDDDSSSDVTTWYLDADKDSYGNPKLSKKACKQIVGYVINKDDCDDFNNKNNPKGVEVCDGVDNDCDGQADEPDAADSKTLFVDKDGDGYGTSSELIKSCKQQNGFSMVAGDCDDSVKGVNPGATEMCDVVDNDCDGKTDESDAKDAKTLYLDLDKDGHGNSAASIKTCKSIVEGYSEKKGDCNDQNEKINPMSMEVCDNVDNDCDGKTDEPDAMDAKTWYLDADKDGYGNSAKLKKACKAPDGYVADHTDCDDTDNDNHPKAKEVCDDKEDNDCNGKVDNDDPVCKQP
jgi:hypothetical protein